MFKRKKQKKQKNVVALEPISNESLGSIKIKRNRSQRLISFRPAKPVQNIRYFTELSHCIRLESRKLFSFREAVENRWKRCASQAKWDFN